VRAWKYWAYFNLGCIHCENGEEYASNAMNGFATLIKLTRPSLHYLCQLYSLFFQFGSRLSNFESAAENLTSLSPNSVIQIIPQLMVQFENRNTEVSQVVFTIIRSFAKKHFQALAMPLILAHRTTTSSSSVQDFLEQMKADYSELIEETDKFTNALL
jgi:hypothetical protein